METDYFTEEKTKVQQYMDKWDDLQKVFGRNKVDLAISDIAEGINTNPNAFTFGESCSGHLTNYEHCGKKRPHIGQGFLAICLRSSFNSDKFVGSLEQLASKNNLVKIEKRDNEIYRAGRLVECHPLFLIRIGEDRHDSDISNLRPMMVGYLDAWNHLAEMVNAYL